MHHCSKIRLRPWWFRLSSSANSLVRESGMCSFTALADPNQPKSARKQQRSETSSSASSGCKTNVENIITIPEATWSVASLELDKNHKPINYDELKILAKRAVIDIEHNKVNKDELCQDLGNMMHMIQQVQKTHPSDNEEFMKLSTEDIYDVPRNVTSSPLRFCNKNTNDDENSPEDKKQNENVWNSLLKPKTVMKGAHHYFVIATGIKRNKNKKD